MKRARCGNWNCFRDEYSRCMCAVCFGLGMTVASFCPAGLTLFFAAVLIVALGITIVFKAK